MAQDRTKPVLPNAQGSSTPQIQPLAPDQQRKFAEEYDEGKFTPPSREELYRMDSEAAKFERVRQWRKALGRNDIDFPDEDSIRVSGTLQKRHFQPMETKTKASYVVYQPLYFQQINYERYGWDLGVFQPLVSTAHFYTDVLMLPYNIAVDPPWKCDANAGYALPGDPESLRFLTPAFSWKGVAAQTAAMVGAPTIFP